MFSIIISFYNGEKYLEKLLHNLEIVTSKYYSTYQEKVEVMIVNDSPENKALDQLVGNDYSDLTVLTNSKNVGIHQTRVNGLNQAKNPYIILLDQDDELEEDCLLVYRNELENEDADMLIGNCYFQTKDYKKHPLYVADFDFNIITKKNAYLLIRDFITSPGQCIIKKQSVPAYWKDHILKNNGSDDALLWYLMFNDHLIIRSIKQCTYTHCYTGGNLMFNTEKMDQSMLEVIELLKNNPNYNKGDLNKLIASFDYKSHYYKSKKNLILYTLKHPFVFLYNVYYKLQYKGYTIR